MSANIYKGSKAHLYEKRRKKQAKWRFERAVMIKVLARLGDEIKSVIDAPIGSGIFLPFYKTKVRGYDISQDMLDLAESKKADVTLQKWDLINKPIYAKADLVVCIRFLNLINWRDATKVFKNLLTASKKYILFTIRTVPADFEGKMNVGRVYLHKELALLALLSDCGFVIVERFRHHDAVPGNYDLILCKRSN